MAWQTPKTNWTSNDYINVSDFNRIEGNTQAISDLLTTFSTTPTLGTVKTTWANTDFLYAEELNRIESNVLALKNGFYQPVGWITPVTSWVTGPIGDGYVMANRIETDLLLLYNLATDTKNYLMNCGSPNTICGNDNTIL
jgi:hypothetical protein